MGQVGYSAFVRRFESSWYVTIVRDLYLFAMAYEAKSYRLTLHLRPRAHQISTTRATLYHDPESISSGRAQRERSSSVCRDYAETVERLSLLLSPSARRHLRYVFDIQRRNDAYCFPYFWENRSFSSSRSTSSFALCRTSDLESHRRRAS